MKRSALVVGVLGFVVSIGCQGRIAPLAAQRGSTVLIPLNSEPASPSVGYGGTIGEDYQRGTLVYQLGGPGGPSLETVATGQALPPPSAAILQENGFPRRQVVSLVNIPGDAPLGTHSLHVVRRRLENGAQVDYPGPSYAGQLTILPEEITFLVNGSPQTVIAAETPLEKYFCIFSTCGWADATQEIRDTLPLPELRIRLTANVSALELEVDYPADVITLVDLYEPPGARINHLARIWYEDSPVGFGKAFGMKIPC